MNDIVTILRDISNETDIDSDLAEACRDGAGEIEKLRHRIRIQDAVIRSGDVAKLTEAEREAVWAAWCDYADAARMHHKPTRQEIAATLRGLLERLGGER